MKSRHFFTNALILLVSLAPVAVTAQEFQPDALKDEPWVAEVPCRGNENREAISWIDNRQIRLCFSFEESLLQPAPDGNTNDSQLTIVSYMKKGARNLTDLSIVAESPEDNPGLIIEKAVPGPELSNTLSSMRVFRVRIQVTKQARSKKYPIAAVVTSGAAGERIGFKLPILAPETASIEVEKKPGALVDCWAGSDCSRLEVVVRNKLPYKITISNISIDSEDLLHNKPNGEYVTEFGKNSSPIDLSVPVKANPITFRRVFSGFGAPQVSMRIDYKDEFGRPISTKTTADLQIRPNVLVIAIFLILGAVIGTLVRIDLRRLQREHIITGRQRIVFAATTFASGIVICLIALFANIKLIVWTDQNSYSAWDPKVLFLTALVATVSGLPILYAYLKLPRRSEDTSPPPVNTPTTQTPN